jgi:hypothetical protein
MSDTSSDPSSNASRSQPAGKTAGALGLLVLGLSLNTLAIAVRPAGGARFLLAGAGLVLLVGALAWLLRLAAGRSE